MSKARPTKREKLNAEMFGAIKARDVERLERALPKADLAARDSDGDTALSCAAEIGFAQGVRLLLRGSDPKAACENGWTPLMRAVYAGQAECARLLAGASDARAAQRNGATALILSAMIQDAECMAAVIGGSDLDARDEKGRDAEAWLDTVDPGRSNACRELMRACRLSREEKSALEDAASAPVAAPSRPAPRV